MTVHPSLERNVLIELQLRDQRDLLRDRSQAARALAETLHRGRREMVAHLKRVAFEVPRACRSVAWLHHAIEAGVTPVALADAGLSDAELVAVELLVGADPPPGGHSVLQRARILSNAPGSAGHLARVVARAAILDRLDGARPEGETLTALRLLPNPRLASHRRAP